MECINPLNSELNPICYLLALLGAHNILYFSRIRVNPAENVD
jgi:transposase